MIFSYKKIFLPLIFFSFLLFFSLPNNRNYRTTRAYHTHSLCCAWCMNGWGLGNEPLGLPQQKNEGPQVNVIRSLFEFFASARVNYGYLYHICTRRTIISYKCIILIW